MGDWEANMNQRVKYMVLGFLKWFISHKAHFLFLQFSKYHFLKAFMSLQNTQNYKVS